MFQSLKFDYEFLFVKFPIIFPIIYGLALFLFPNFETYLIFFTILILAETHFGATWPFFLSKSNKPYIDNNKIALIAIPVIIILLCILGFFFIKSIFLLIFFAANMFHVTRQSFGICKLYCKNEYEKKFQEYFIYFFGFLFFFIGFFRFYYPLISNENLFALNFLVIILFLLISIYYLYRFKFSENFLTFFAGCILFYPVCFVSNPVHGIIMGVTMHYTQYLYLTYKVYKGRNNESNIEEKKGVFLKYIPAVLIYSFFMSILSLTGKSNLEIVSYLIIIPLTGQMLHFYLDSQLWKFSVKHNRDNILKYLFN